MVQRLFPWQPILFACFISSTPLLSAPLPISRSEVSLGDRLVLQVNFKVYTQRQLEIYTGVREVLLDKPLTFSGCTTSNWQKKLLQFRDEMVLAEEAGRRERTATTAANETEVNIALTALREFARQSLEFQALIKRVTISTEEQQEAVKAILSIDNFRAKNKIDAPVLQETLLRTSVRFFSGTRDYQLMEFPAAQIKS
jgi:hypothetical protein